MARLSGKVALITGAGSGIGAEIAARFHAEGARLLLTDIDAASVAGTATALGDDVQHLRHDVTSPADWRRAVDTAEALFGGLHVLVNNAGIVGAGGAQTPDAIEVDEWRRIAAVNVEGTMLGCQHAVPLLARSGGGSIVNLSSIAALRPTPGIAGYGAAKAAVRQLTKSVAQHCGDQGLSVRCNSVHPGLIDTQMLHAAFTPAQLEQRLAGIPLRRLGQARDVANAVLFLASDEAAYITGAKLVIDGGVVMD